MDRLKLRLISQHSDGPTENEQRSQFLFRFSTNGFGFNELNVAYFLQYGNFTIDTI